MDLSDWKTATLVAYGVSFAAGLVISPFIASVNYVYKKLAKSEPIGSDYISSLNGAIFTTIGVCSVFPAPEYNYASIGFIPGLMAGIYFGGKVTKRAGKKVGPLLMNTIVRLLEKTNQFPTHVTDKRFGELVLVPNVGWVTKKSLKEAGLEQLLTASKST